MRRLCLRRRVWVSIAGYSPISDTYAIHNVTGPDEYTAIVDNDCYTNMLAQAPPLRRRGRGMGAAPRSQFDDLDPAPPRSQAGRMWPTS